MKGFSIILSFVFLFQSIGLKMNDLVQIDEFIEHAQFHNEQYGDNFFVFVSKHYGELKADHNKEHQEEKSDHEQLPFQHNMYVSSIAILSWSPNKLDLSAPDYSDYKLHNFFYQESSSSLYTEGLFQPPRFI
ncbi:hypothetical protein [Psychroserpens jangbogonensis]|uniref:hypothetical protein n=1 Tax=Psychroserpens jangbogonensis TaxID=1484460 RepID=UPI00053E8A2F|nr:hypothetical protein [Psychroserpens jangbogonensis]